MESLNVHTVSSVFPLIFFALVIISYLGMFRYFYRRNGTFKLSHGLYYFSEYRRLTQQDNGRTGIFYWLWIMAIAMLILYIPCATFFLRDYQRYRFEPPCYINLTVDKGRVPIYHRAFDIEPALRPQEPIAYIEHECTVKIENLFIYGDVWALLFFPSTDCFEKAPQNTSFGNVLLKDISGYDKCNVPQKYIDYIPETPHEH